MSWDAYHHRKAALQEILTLADARRDIGIDDALDAVPGAREAFPTAADLLFDMQFHWTSTLNARLDVLVGEGAETPEIGVIAAWVETAGLLPGARRLLDSARDEPALARAFAKENAALACAAGVPVMSPNLADRGRLIADSARTHAVLPEIEQPTTRPGGLIGRLRQALMLEARPA